MSRSYSTFRQHQPFSDGWKEATYSSMAPSDHVHRPLIIDAEGRQRPIIRYGSGPNGETYVIKAEIVEHSIVPAPDFVTSYRLPLAGEEKFRDYGGENRHRHLGSNYGYPEKVEELLTKVVNEACRGPTTRVAVPVTRAWHSGPNWMENSRKYDDERDFSGDDCKKLNDSPYRNRHPEPYLNSKGTHPMKGSDRDVFEFYERPRGNEAHNAGNHLLSKPTNDINTAMENLMKEYAKPSYGVEKEKEMKESGKLSYGSGNEKEFNTPSAKTFPLGTTRWRTGPTARVPDIKVESRDYDSEEDEEEEEIRNPYGKRDELKIANNRGGEPPWEYKDKIPNNRGGEKPFENKDGYEIPKRNPAAVQFGQTAGHKKNPQTIDSKEASMKYGKLLPRAMKKEDYEGTIDSKKAMEKYNGALVP